MPKPKIIRIERDTLKRLAKKIDKWRFHDQSGIDNYYFERLFDDYVSVQGEKIVGWVKKIFELQKEETRSYGDADWSVDIIKNTPKHKVMRVRDHVTCGDLTDFLVTLTENKLHIRKLWKNSDYRKGNQYVSCPNFKFYKDRNFNMEFNERLHHTPLGGVYGDARDDGYIVTYRLELDYALAMKLTKGDKRIEDVASRIPHTIKVEDGNMRNFCDLKQTAFTLNHTANDLEGKYD